MKGFVYFIQAEHGGPIKIGFAQDVQERLRQLQCGNPHRLVVRYAQELPAAKVAENQLHKLFAAHRMMGEWFEPVPALAKIARAIPGDGADALEYGWMPHGAESHPNFGGWFDTAEEAAERHARLIEQDAEISSRFAA